MRQEIIEKKLHNAFSPKHLQVVNESYMHNVPAGSESHFKVIVVSDEFDGLRLIARHRKINQLLAEELQDGLHALSIHTYTESEWLIESGLVPKTPDCLGGNKK
ncbi:BolA/IbaG family iron-sulfur metabolism protein [Vibrio sp. DW001]|jgi:BolA protein|uniref:BolA family protein n=1 Tax=unclassified Vibrio TaxID=2614977 RepID=UPI0023B03265|nr:BolA/IbaG family iron-sulfur metabolism protein [Vibrio sp. DW001]WED26033.1 BolA/IbaG family iron-sulfur metabolism protein [Vibrio sp. DW001]